MAEVNTGETAQLLAYARNNSKVSAKLAAAFLDIPERKAWIHLQRLVSTGYLEVHLEAKCFDSDCLGVTDVSTFFKNSAGMPVSFECHGCGNIGVIDLDDTSIIFACQNILLNNKIQAPIVTDDEIQTHDYESKRFVRGCATAAAIVGFGGFCGLLVLIMIAVVLTI